MKDPRTEELSLGTKRWLEEFIARGDGACEWLMSDDPRPFHNIRGDGRGAALRALALMEPYLRDAFGNLAGLKVKEMGPIEASRFLVDIARRIIVEQGG